MKAKKKMLERGNKNEMVKTTVYLPRRLYESAKFMAIYTRSSLTKLVKVSLSEKIEKLKSSIGED